MAFQIDPSIPLQAQRTTFDPATILMQAQTNAANLEKHRFEMQKLREDYDLAKEKRKQEKAMQMGIASDLERIQSGTPAQYSQPSYAQTMPTGQMPQGMTGVLASERGQQMPQPAMFGENILQGNVDFNREMVSPAVQGREPSYIEMLKIGYKNAAMNQDIESAFKFGNMIKQAEIAEREQNAPVGNPYQRYDDKGALVGTYILTKGGEIPFGQQGTTTVKPDVVSASDKFKEQKAAERQARELAQKEREAFIKAQIEANKPKVDIVQRASDIADAKADAKIRQDLVNDAANVTKTYQILTPMIDNALTIVKKLPPDMMQSFFQSKLAGTPLNKYLGNTEQQKAITDYNVMLENLRLFIEKPAGAISNYEQGILGRAIGILEGNYSVEQKESTLKRVKGIFDNQNNVALKVLKQNKGDKFIFGNNQQNNAPLRFKRESTSTQRKEYADAIIAANGDSEKIREIQEYARDIGVLE